MILAKGILVGPEHENQITMDDGVNRKGRIRGNVYSVLIWVFFFFRRLQLKMKGKREGCLFY